MTRITGVERREQVLEIAAREFAEFGLRGASVDAIAQDAGISQPYIYRMFGSKVALFNAAFEKSMADLTREMIGAAEGLNGIDAAIAMGNYYRDLVRNKSVLMFKLQGFAASIDDDVRETVRETYGREWESLARHAGLTELQMKIFMCLGPLLNNLAAIGMFDVDEDWNAGTTPSPITREIYDEIGCLAATLDGS